MKAKVIGVKGDSGKEIELPELFSALPREDLVARAFWVLSSHGRQPYGRDPMAGMKTSAETYNPPTGRGVARVPRVKGGGQRSGQAAGIASVVKGRLPHPPKAEKVIYRKINKKERHLALANAIAFTKNHEAVVKRGHRVGRLELPLVVSDEVETIPRTSELRSFLAKVGLEEELTRLYRGIKRASGKPRQRGRAYRTRVGPLIVIANDRGVGKAVSTIPGAEVVPAESLSVLQLAPGGVPGRLTLWTESAIEIVRSMEKEVEPRIAT
ncbi:MAG: 50S ribosomal protein L4 [Thaumarchaeota archaeon]|nr:50S ribosomal protein L4 [Nitrososphaerota archaeon]